MFRRYVVTCKTYIRQRERIKGASRRQFVTRLISNPRDYRYRDRSSRHYTSRSVVLIILNLRSRIREIGRSRCAIRSFATRAYVLPIRCVSTTLLFPSLLPCYTTNSNYTARSHNQICRKLSPANPFVHLFPHERNKRKRQYCSVLQY